MDKILIIDAEKCTGCRTCEAACSFYHEKEFSPSRSRVRIIKWEEVGLDVPVLCMQCDNPVCTAVCPVKALTRDSKTGAILLDYDVCLGCKMCIMVCPFGSISIDAKKGKPIKCDLCGGEPVCAEFCPTGAITYVKAERANLILRRASLEKLGLFLRKG